MDECKWKKEPGDKRQAEADILCHQPWVVRGRRARGTYDATGERLLGRWTLAGAGDAPRGTLAAQEGIRSEVEEQPFFGLFGVDGMRPWPQLAGLGLAGNAIVINWIQYS